MFKQQSGWPIGENDANAEIEQFQTLTERGHGVVSGFNNLFWTHDKASKNFFSSDKNAFIFSRDEVLKYFTKKDGSLPSPNDREGTAEYLMIILSAHTKVNKKDKHPDFPEGAPTVIIAGVEEVGLEIKESSSASIKHETHFRTTFQSKMDGHTSGNGGDDNQPGDEWPYGHHVKVFPQSEYHKIEKLAKHKVSEDGTIVENDIAVEEFSNQIIFVLKSDGEA